MANLSELQSKAAQYEVAPNDMTWTVIQSKIESENIKYKAKMYKWAVATLVGVASMLSISILTNTQSSSNEMVASNKGFTIESLSQTTESTFSYQIDELRSLRNLYTSKTM